MALPPGLNKAALAAALSRAAPPPGGPPRPVPLAPMAGAMGPGPATNNVMKAPGELAAEGQQRVILDQAITALRGIVSAQLPPTRQQLATVLSMLQSAAGQRV